MAKRKQTWERAARKRKAARVQKARTRQEDMAAAAAKPAAKSARNAAKSARKAAKQQDG